MHMKQKKLYEQPEATVIELRVTNQLLAGSPDLKGFGDEEEWSARPFDEEGLWL